MFGAADLIDDEQLVNHLLKRDAPTPADIPWLRTAGVIEAELDVDSIDMLPFTTYRVSGSGQDGNGPGIWTATLTMNVYLESGDAAFDVCRHWYRKVHRWSVPGEGVVDGVGSVSEVEDLSKFSRVVSGLSIIGKHATQYVGSFGLALRSPM